MAKSQKTTFMTPKGTAVYPWLSRPDTQFDAEGVYKTKLKLPADEGKALAERIRKVANDEFGNKAAKARMPFETDDETGELVFLAKSRYVSWWTHLVRLSPLAKPRQSLAAQP